MLKNDLGVELMPFVTPPAIAVWGDRDMQARLLYVEE